MKMFFNHGIHRIHGMIVSLVLLFGVAVPAVAAEPGITVEARQRYPWNGLVDLKFTITGESGTKYDTSFVAKDMVGGTNVAMKTIRKSDGTTAAEKEKLLPGTYNWIWDAPADLQVDTVSYDDFLTDSSKVVITNRLLSATANFYAVFGGSSISQSIGSTEGYAYNVKTDGNGKSIQFQVLNGGYLKCVCVHLEQSGINIVGHIKWARYMSPTFPLGTDFDTAEYTEYDISTSDSVGGYGIKQLVLTYPNTSREPKFDRLTVTGTADISAFPYTVKFNANGGTGTMANQSFTYGTSKALTANAFTRTGYVFQGWATSASGAKVYSDKQQISNLTEISGTIVNLYAVWLYSKLYMVVDLPSGSVSYLPAVPTAGWGDTYKTTKLVMRYVESGSFKLLGTSNIKITKPYYIAVFELTQGQYKLITGEDAHHFYPEWAGNTKPVHIECFEYYRGSYNWPENKNIDTSSVLGKLRMKTGLKFDFPTESQWEYACRAGTNSRFNNGGDSMEDFRAIASTDDLMPVGSYQPNKWGIYDMTANAAEMCLDWYSEVLPSGNDPLGPTTGTQRVGRGGWCTYADWWFEEWLNTDAERSNQKYNPSFGELSYGVRLCAPVP